MRCNSLCRCAGPSRNKRDGWAASFESDHANLPRDRWSMGFIGLVRQYETYRVGETMLRALKRPNCIGFKSAPFISCSLTGSDGFVVQGNP